MEAFKDLAALSAVREALAKLLPTHPEAEPIEMAFESGTLTLEGEMASVADKKRALEMAAAVGGIDGIVDRLTVRPAERMSDLEIEGHLARAFFGEPSFADLNIRVRRGGRDVPYQDAAGRRAGEIVVEAKDGIVILNGAVPGLDHKRLAGLMAWWVPGSRDVVNGLAVEPFEEDAPDKLEEAVRIALEKDPFIDAAQVRVGVRNRTVRLTGALASDHQRHMAECDAWYVFAVDQVINEIKVVPPRT
jgi:osmotically-inducible protein OsmY